MAPEKSDMTLPVVGQAVQAHPFFGIDNVPGKLPAVVVYVNKAHHYFTVRFASGYCEAFRIGAKEVSY